VKGLETPFSLLGGGHAAGEFGDFDEEGVVLLAPVEDEFVAHFSQFRVGRFLRLGCDNFTVFPRENG